VINDRFDQRRLIVNDLTQVQIQLNLMKAGYRRYAYKMTGLGYKDIGEVTSTFSD